MTMTPEQARAAIRGRKKPKLDDRETKRLSKAKAKAQQQALMALRELHREEYDALYAVALEDALADDEPEDTPAA